MGGAAALAALSLAVAAPWATPSSGSTDERAMGRVLVKSHGVQMYAYPSHWDWRPEDGPGAAGVIDYAYDSNPRRLPIHPGPTIRLRTAASARAVSVHFARKNGWRRVSAKARNADGTRWSVRAPRHLKRKGRIGIDADYRYEKDGQLYGMRYSFFLPVRLHRHR